MLLIDVHYIASILQLLYDASYRWKCRDTFDVHRFYAKLVTHQVNLFAVEILGINRNSFDTKIVHDWAGAFYITTRAFMHGCHAKTTKHVTAKNGINLE